MERTKIVLLHRYKVSLLLFLLVVAILLISIQYLPLTDIEVYTSGKKKLVLRPTLRNDTLLLSTSDKILLDELEKTTKQIYRGRQVDVFLKDSIFKNYLRFDFVDEPPGVLAYLALIYSDKINIEIKVDKYQYIKQFNENLHWDMDVFRKEMIKEVRLIVLDSLDTVAYSKPIN